MYLLLHCLFLLGISLYSGIGTKFFPKQHEQKVIIGILFLYSLLIALRPLDTKDTLAYVNLYNQIDGLVLPAFGLFSKVKGIEYGFIVLMKIMSFFCIPYQLFLFILAFSTNLLIYSFFTYFIKVYYPSLFEKSNILIIILLFYICSYGLMYSGVAIRAGLSVGVMLLGIRILEQKHIKSAILLMLIAFSFHKMCIVILIAYMIWKYIPVLEKRTYFIITLLLGLLLVSGATDFLLRISLSSINGILTFLGIHGYSAYFNSIDSAIGIIDLYWLFYTLVLCYFLSNEKADKKVFQIILSGLLVISFFHGIRAINRIYDYFYIFSIVPICKMIYAENRNIRLISCFLIFCNAVLMIRLCFF